LLHVITLNLKIFAAPGNILPIHWYIMTSPFTHDVTRKFFESRKYFGLEAEQVRTSTISSAALNIHGN
jgi:UDP-N-acetylglucosamine pyrophosphorylase